MSRTLDGLIAQHLFGWQWVDMSNECEGTCVLHDPQVAKSVNRTMKDPSQHRIIPDYLPSYTTDWNAMHQVVERMHEKNWDLFIETNCVVDSPYWVVFVPHGESWEPSHREGSLPLAVSLAALRALGVPEAEIKEARRV